MTAYFWLGASADADPALVASAASRLAPPGVDPLRCSRCGREMPKVAAEGVTYYGNTNGALFCSYRCSQWHPS